MQKKTSIDGFALTELLIVIVVVLVLGVIGAFVYHQHNKAKPSTVANGSSTGGGKIDSYAGWSSYTTKYDKLSFKYPASWALSDNSNTDNTDITPGADSVTLTSNDGLRVAIGTGGTEFDGGNPGIVILSTTPVTMLGGTHYLIFTGSNNAAGGAVITTSNTLPSISTLPASKNIKLSSAAVSGLPTPFDVISLQYSETEGSNIHYSVSKFEADPNYKAAISIIESIAY